VLPNGLVVLLSEDHSLPFVTFRLLMDAGARRDPQDQEGLANLTARALLLGTAKRTVLAIHEELDFMGAYLNASAAKDYTALQLKILKKDLDQGLDLFMDAITRPVFPEEEIKKEIEKILAGITSMDDDPQYVANVEFLKALYGRGPYAHPVAGTRESVARLSRKEAETFFRAHYQPFGSILTVVGDLSPEELEKKIVPLLSPWPAGKKEDPPPPAVPDRKKKTASVNRALTQANILMGHQGVKRSDPDYYALTLMNYILGGGGFTSRLTEEIREKKGLAYSVYSYFDPDKENGTFQIVLQTKNASAREAISLALKELERIRTEPVKPEELEGAKKYLVGSFPMRLDTQGKLATFLSHVEFYGLGLDYVQKYPSLIGEVTREEILRVAGTYLRPEEWITVVVGNLKEAGLD
jgi:zinc protease